jgi:hypothetical protein
VASVVPIPPAHEHVQYRRVRGSSTSRGWRLAANLPFLQLAPGVARADILTALPVLTEPQAGFRERLLGIFEALPADVRNLDPRHGG